MHREARFPNVIFDARLRPRNAAFALMLTLFLLLFFLVFLTFTASPAQGQNFNVIYNFTGGADGLWPGGLTIDAHGNLYGTANGGEFGHGTVYRLTHNTSGWHLDPLYAFSGRDGWAPLSRVLFGPGGALYGTSWAGGDNRSGNVFSLIPPRTAREKHWFETVLYNFMGGSDGDTPLGDPIFDQEGNIYGVTYAGGYGYGIVFELSRNGWNESVIYRFTGGNDGARPNGVTLQAGNLYGTTIWGGGFGYGTVFKLTSSGSGWAENTLYSFQGGHDGGYSRSGVIFDSVGNMYGSTSDDAGGAYGPGTIWELMPSGSSWTFSTLYNFTAPGCAQPEGPVAPLTMDQAGNLYGTTYGNGAYCYGSVFKLSPSKGGQWTYTSLHDFTGGSDGASPGGNVIIDASGNLYGTAYIGGANGLGVVWETTP